MNEQKPGTVAANDQLEAELIDVANQVARYNRQLHEQGIRLHAERLPLLRDLQRWLLADQE